MNLSYLLRYISHHLNTIVRQYSPQGALLESCCAHIHFDDEPIGAMILSLFYSVLESSDVNPVPMILNINHQYAYVWIPDAETQYIIGPVQFTIMPDFKHQVTIEDQGENWRESISLCKFETFTEDCLLLYNLRHSGVLGDDDFLAYNIIYPDTESELQEHYTNLMFENREAGKRHNPFDQELREFSSIAEGNMEHLKQSLSEVYLGEVGTLAKDPLRHAKNRAIVVVTLASRAAIRGGVSPELAFTLSDSYIQKVEECTDIKAVFQLFLSAEYQYTQMVYDLKKPKNSGPNDAASYHISRCKDYIMANLHGKIQVQDIAEKLGLNANYLSELFHKSEHVSLKDFIQKEKINMARNLLIYSKYSYTEIAVYLGYSSQSHFGKQFKKYADMTPRRYREVYGAKNFLE